MINLESKITDVTVYRFGAGIIRTAFVPDKINGDSVFKITGLPLVLQDSSVKIKLIPGNNNNNNIPEALDYKIIVEEPDMDSEDLSDIEKKIEDIEKNILSIKDQIEQIDYWLNILSKSRIKERHVDEKSGPVKSLLDKRIEFLKTKNRKVNLLIKEKTEKHSELLDTQKMLLDLKTKKAAMSSQEKYIIPKKSCIITFSESNKLKNTKIQFNYMVPGACWAPSYILHLDKEYSNAELVLNALICQYTGEDWENVNITLSTALPQSWTDLPELASLRIGRRQQAVKKSGFREAPAGTKELYSDFIEEFKVLVKPEIQKREEPVTYPPEQESIVSGFRALDEKETEEVNYSEAEPESMFDMMMQPEESDADGITPVPKMYSKAKMDRARRGKISKPKKARMRMSASIAAEEKKILSGENHDETGEITASTDFLDFARLRMPGYGSDKRGELEIISNEKCYEDICRQNNLRIMESYKSAFDISIENAASVKNIKLPEGLFIAESYNGFDYAFKGETPADIPSNNIFHNIKIMKFKSSPELYYETVPREDTGVYRFITMKNELEAPLLIGACDIFIGGNYTAKGNIKFTSPKGNICLGLGVEQGIKVSRNIKYNEESAGLVGSNIKLNHSIEIKVRNLTRNNIRVFICERIPVTDLKQEDIKISVTNTNPGWKEFNPKMYNLRGGYYWDINIESSKEELLKADYTITISSKNELINGNRREA